MPAEVPGLGEVTMTQRNTKPPNITFIFAMFTFRSFVIALPTVLPPF